MTLGRCLKSTRKSFKTEADAQPKKELDYQAISKYDYSLTIDNVSKEITYLSMSLVFTIQ